MRLERKLGALWRKYRNNIAQQSYGTIKKSIMKPTLKRFREVARKCNGNVSVMAAALAVYRSTIYDWMKDDAEFKTVIDDYRGRLFDKCLKTAELLANGVPTIELTETGEQFTGWKVMPDTGMLRYLLSTLGKKEGFGEEPSIEPKDEKTTQEPITIEIIDSREQVRNNQETNQ